MALAHHDLPAILDGEAQAEKEKRYITYLLINIF